MGRCLDDYVGVYNHSPHSGLGGATPLEAAEHPGDTLKFHAQSKRAKTKAGKVLQVGDIVRIKRKKGVFDKGYLRNWSDTTHMVIEVEKANYKLDNCETYRSGMLQQVTQHDKEQAKDQVKAAHKENKIERELSKEDIKEANIAKKPKRERNSRSIMTEFGPMVIQK